MTLGSEEFYIHMHAWSWPRILIDFSCLELVIELSKRNLEHA